MNRCLAARPRLIPPSLPAPKPSPAVRLLPLFVCFFQMSLSDSRWRTLGQFYVESLPLDPWLWHGTHLVLSATERSHRVRTLCGSPGASCMPVRLTPCAVRRKPTHRPSRWWSWPPGTCSGTGGRRRRTSTPIPPTAVRIVLRHCPRATWFALTALRYAGVRPAGSSWTVHDVYDNVVLASAQSPSVSAHVVRQPRLPTPASWSPDPLTALRLEGMGAGAVAVQRGGIQFRRARQRAYRPAARLRRYMLCAMGANVQEVCLTHPVHARTCAQQHPHWPFGR